MTTTHIPNREEALELLLKYNETVSLINHAKSVESVMRHIASILNEDIDKWGIVGLVHDLDYEKFPDLHCQKTKEILDEAAWDYEYIRAVLSHGWGMVTDVEPQSLMEKYLFAIDELTGLVTACILVRPSKSANDLEVKSVIKKWKDKSFAAGANRDVILQGTNMLGVELDYLIQLVIDGIKSLEN